MTRRLIELDPKNVAFPSVDLAWDEPNGLLAYGGDLSPRRLLTAYANGIFPWYAPDDPILWWFPTPRAVLFHQHLKINRSLRKALNKHAFEISMNCAFQQVIAACADERYRHDGTWILPEMQQAYRQLHALGYAHSVEVWLDGQLVGGLYGVAINGFFAGESMFHRCDHAAKVALIYLSQKLASQGVNAIDCQISNPFLEQMGCQSIDKTDFIQLKQDLLNLTLDDHFWQQNRTPFLCPNQNRLNLP